MATCWTEHTPGSPCQSIDENSYKFHTNILSVNQQIHDEAEEVLSSRNGFVDFAQRVDVGLPSEIQLWAPVVSTSNVGQMKHCSLSIKLSYSSLGLSRIKTQVRLKGSPATKRFFAVSK